MPKLRNILALLLVCLSLSECMGIIVPAPVLPAGGHGESEHGD
jgi:hypothetical protein